MNARPEVVGVEDIIDTTGKGDYARQHKQVDELIKLLALALLPMRTQPDDDVVLIAALLTYAGSIYGGLSAMGIAPDMTHAAKLKHLETNWDTGVAVGKRHVDHVARDLGVDPTTGRPPE